MIDRSAAEAALSARAAALTDSIALSAPPVGIGVCAAHTVAVAAGLCESLARTTVGRWEDAPGVVAQAGHIRTRALAVATQSGEAFAQARDRLEARRRGASGGDGTLRAVLVASADLLVLLAAVAVDTVELAAAVADQLPAELRPDAAGAVELAAAAAVIVGDLIAVNLALGPADPRRQAVAASVQAAQSGRAAVRSSLLG